MPFGRADLKYTPHRRLMIWRLLPRQNANYTTRRFRQNDCMHRSLSLSRAKPHGGVPLVTDCFKTMGNHTSEEEGIPYLVLLREGAKNFISLRQSPFLSPSQICLHRSLSEMPRESVGESWRGWSGRVVKKREAQEKVGRSERGWRGGYGC